MSRYQLLTEEYRTLLDEDILAIDASLSPGSLEAGLANLKTRVAYFRQSMDEVTRRVEAQGGGFVCSKCAVMPRVSLPLHSSTPISRSNLRGRSPP